MWCLLGLCKLIQHDAAMQVAAVSAKRQGTFQHLVWSARGNLFECLHWLNVRFAAAQRSSCHHPRR